MFWSHNKPVEMLLEWWSQALQTKQGKDWDIFNWRNFQDKSSYPQEVTWEFQGWTNVTGWWLLLTWLLLYRTSPLGNAVTYTWGYSMMYLWLELPPPNGKAFRRWLLVRKIPSNPVRGRNFLNVNVGKGEHKGNFHRQYILFAWHLLQGVKWSYTQTYLECK